MVVELAMVSAFLLGIIIVTYRLCECSRVLKNSACGNCGSSIMRVWVYLCLVGHTVRKALHCKSVVSVLSVACRLIISLTKMLGNLFLNCSNSSCKLFGRAAYRSRCEILRYEFLELPLRPFGRALLRVCGWCSWDKC